MADVVGTTEGTLVSKAKSGLKEFNPLKSPLSIKQKVGAGVAAAAVFALGVASTKLATVVAGGLKKKKPVEA